MNGSSTLRGRPTKALRPRPPQTRRQRFIDLARALSAHESQTDLFSPARRAHAKFHLLRERGAAHEAMRDLRKALKEIRQRDVEW